MGKKLIINGADFSQNSVNGINESLYDAIGEALLVGKALSANNSGGAVSISDNEKRCCVYNFDLSYYYNLGYRHIKINSANAETLDFILGLGATSACYYYDETGNPTDFVWKQVSSLEGSFGSVDSLFINIRYHNNTDVFPLTTKLGDLISSVELT